MHFTASNCPSCLAWFLSKTHTLILVTASHNTVGYNSTTLRDGSLGVAPQFEGIASADGSYDLQQIKCNEAASDLVSFCVLSATGIDGESFTWTTTYDPEYSGNPESCWINGEGDKVVGYKIYPGDGLWVAGTEDNTQIFQSSGQVGKQDVSVVLRDGSLMTGNPFPVKIDLQDIVCSDPCSDLVSFCLLSATGIDGESYTWTTTYDPEYSGNPESCWINGEGDKVEEFTVTPGMGLWVAGTQDPVDPKNPNPETDQIITFPAPEL